LGAARKPTVQIQLTLSRPIYYESIHDACLLVAAFINILINEMVVSADAKSILFSKQGNNIMHTCMSAGLRKTKTAIFARLRKFRQSKKEEIEGHSAPNLHILAAKRKSSRSKILVLKGLISAHELQFTVNQWRTHRHPGCMVLR
jgi:hypothetical protein